MTAGDKLRSLIEREEPPLLPYGACALHGLLAERAGFETFALSGAWISVHSLAMPDYSFLSLEELETVTRRTVAATSIPVIADLDQGFGNAINARYGVQAMIRAGAAGIHMEDQPFPKRCGFTDGKEIVASDEMVGKLLAADDARREHDPSFVIIARTDALSAKDGGMEEAIRRANLYATEGRADLIYVEGPTSMDQVRELREAIDGPMFCSLTTLPQASWKELAEAGQCLIPLAELIAEPSLVATWEMLKETYEGGSAAWENFLASTADHPLSQLRALDLVGQQEILEMEKRFLPS